MVPFSTRRQAGGRGYAPRWVAVLIVMLWLTSPVHTGQLDVPSRIAQVQVHTSLSHCCESKLYWLSESDTEGVLAASSDASLLEQSRSLAAAAGGLRRILFVGGHPSSCSGCFRLTWRRRRSLREKVVRQKPQGNETFSCERVWKCSVALEVLLPGETGPTVWALQGLLGLLLPCTGRNEKRHRFRRYSVRRHSV